MAGPKARAGLMAVPVYCDPAQHMTSLKLEVYAHSDMQSTRYNMFA